MGRSLFVSLWCSAAFSPVSAFAGVASGLTGSTSSTVSNSFARRSPFVNSRFRTQMTMASSTEEFVKSEISSNKVVVFSKSYCPFCTRTKDTLTGLNIDFKVHELDEIQSKLLDMSGQRTVPNVYVNGNHLGGNDDTQ